MNKISYSKTSVKEAELYLLAGKEPGSNLTLDEINDVFALTRGGGVMFVSLLMAVGLVGNLHACYIYLMKYRESARRTYVLSISFLDLLTCIVIMPFTIVELLNPLKFDNVAICKIYRFANYVMSTTSAWILVVIAYDRYCKICRPLDKHMTARRAMYLCIGCLAVSFLVSWPAAVLYGHRTIETGIQGINGVTCFSDDKYRGTYYQAAFNSVLLIIVIVAIVLMIVMYALIVKKLRKQNKTLYSLRRPIQLSVASSNENDHSEAVEISPKHQLDKSETCLCDAEESPKLSRFKRFQSFVSSKRNLIVASKSVYKGRRTRRDQLSSVSTVNTAENQIHTKRISWMFSIITLVFIVSFIPHLILNTLNFADKNFFRSLDKNGLVLFQTFIWSFFVNNSANPIIYGFCDAKFRSEFKKMYRPFCFVHKKPLDTI